MQNRHIGLGDLVLSTGAVYELANKYPNINFTYLSIPAGQEILSNYPANVKVVVFENKLFLYGNGRRKYIRQFIKANWYGIIKNIIKLRKEKYDLALTNRSSTIEFIFMLLYGAKFRLGFPTYAGENILTHKLARQIGHEHVALEWSDIVEYLTHEGKYIRPVLFPSQKEIDKFKNNLISTFNWDTSLPSILIHNGASTPVRKWGIDNYCEVINMLEKHNKFNRIWFGDDAEVNIIRKYFGNKEVVMNYNGPLRQLIYAIYISNIFLGNDSGPMHIAAAMDKIILAIYGPTLTNLYGPFTDKSHVLQKDVCQYRPCFDQCKYNTPICMDAIKIDHVFKLLMKLFALSSVKDQ
jgi:ADP-heptose:LPS heptosyltransferase